MLCRVLPRPISSARMPVVHSGIRAEGAKLLTDCDIHRRPQHKHFQHSSTISGRNVNQWYPTKSFSAAQLAVPHASSSVPQEPIKQYNSVQGKEQRRHKQQGGLQNQNKKSHRNNYNAIADKPSIQALDGTVRISNHRRVKIRGRSNGWRPALFQPNIQKYIMPEYTISRKISG